jgi:tetratricopeptide (TPR) repeat protein
LSGHLAPEQFEKMLAGKLSRREKRSLMAHLLAGCEDCKAALHPGPQPEQAYDRPILAAFETVRAQAREAAEAKRWLATYLQGGRRTPFLELPRYRRKQLATWGFCSMLLRASYALRRDYPAQMVELAEIAVEASRLVPLAPFGLRQVRDLEARALGELANACRVADDLPRAEKFLVGAFERVQWGTGDPLLLARLHDLAASLFTYQRRFEDASRSLEEAYGLFMGSGDRHAGGRVLIKVGILSFYAGDVESAWERFYQGLKQLDRRRDADLVFLALHNYLHATVDLGDFREARPLLQDLRPLYTLRAKRTDEIRLTWTEGRIAVALEDFAAAELALKQSKDEFARAGLFYHAAGAGLELAAVWFQQGKTAEVKEIVGELVATFARVRVQREALAALLVLNKALVREAASLELIQRTCAAVQRFTGERR